MKNFIIPMLLFISITISAQTSLQSIPVINPDTLPIITANRTLSRGYAKLKNYYQDEICYANQESEVVCYAFQQLAYSKYKKFIIPKDSTSARRESWFIHVQMDNESNNEEQRLISALNIAKTKGCLKNKGIGTPYPITDSYDKYSEYDKFEALLNTMDYGRLQSPSPDLIKKALNKGYPIIVYFKDCNYFHHSLYDPHIFGDYDIAVGTKANLPAESNTKHAMGVIVGNEYYVSNDGSYIFEDEVFLMQVLYGKLGTDERGYSSQMVRVQVSILDTDIFEYAIIPYNLCPDLLPTIEGKDNLVCEEVYSIAPLKNTSIQWSVSKLLSIASDNQSNQVTVTPISVLEAEPQKSKDIGITILPPAMPKHIVYATCTKSGVKYTVSKEIKLISNETPTVTLNGGTSYVLEKPSKLEVTNLSKFRDEDIVWSLVSSTNGASLSSNFGRSITVTPMQLGNIKIKVTNTAGCEPHNSKILNYYSVVQVIAMSFNNPAKGILNVQIDEKYENNNNITNELSLYEQEEYQNKNYQLELVDKNNKVVRYQTIENSSASVQFNLRDLQPDVYVLRLISDNQLIDSQKVIVQVP